MRNNTLKKLTLWTATLALSAAVLAGCGGGNSAPAADNGATQEAAKQEGTEKAEEASSSQEQTEREVDESRETNLTRGERYDSIKVGIRADPQSLAPVDCMSGTKQLVNRTVIESLFDAYEGDYVPVLAKSLDKVDDLHWDVEIYDYIHDSENNPITADDVVFSYDLHVNGGYAVRYDSYAGIEKLDDYKVRFTWNNPVNGINELEHVFCHTPIISQKAYEASPDEMATTLIGTGPYKIKSITGGAEYVLEANDNYWQTNEDLIVQGHHQYVQTVYIEVVPEEAQRVMALSDGTMVWVQDLSKNSLESLESNDNVVVEKYLKKNSFQLLYGNMSGNSIWSDENFRLACFYAIDCNQVAAAVGGEPTYCMANPIAPEYFDTWNNEENYMKTVDIDKAKEYLAKTDYKGEELSFLVGQMEGNPEAAAQVIQIQLQQVGINVKLNVLSNELARAAQNDPNGFDIALTGGNGDTVISSWNRILDTADYNGDCSLGFIKDPEMVSMFKEYNTLENYTFENVDKLYDYVMDKAYFGPMYYILDQQAYSAKLAKLGLTLDNWPAYGDMVVYED